MRIFCITTRRALYGFALLLTLTLVISTSCSTDNDPAPKDPPPVDNGNNGEEGNGDKDNEGNGPSGSDNSMQAILNELEKHENLSLFVTALKTSNIEFTDEPLTIFAVENSAFTEDKEAGNSDSPGISHHIVKGSYPIEKLQEHSQIQSIDGLRLTTEYVRIYMEEEERLLLYINETVIDNEVITVGENMIYMTDTFFPTSIQLPDEQDEDFLKIIGKKIEGEWRMTEHRTFEIIYKDANVFTTDEIPTDPIHTFCFETFYWNPASGAFGTYNLDHAGDHSGTEIGAVGSNRRREEGPWRVVSSTDEDAIASLDFCFFLGSSLRSAVKIPLDKETGIGTQMKYIIKYPGESLNPPNMYPSMRREETFLLQKTKNKP
ncbi:MAG: hypothetical protein LUF85_04030 [Bacteroides sp.]|nr:hypothetical protein [Bacteroides sp.]